ncbi:MAG: branched-chain amino acid ABC transporter permease, partial [Alphaproteobacteria bacterium]|nr:branched-chain amino acid ABC transporter permease [Alphaproteobacteria bacterium]
MRGGGRPPASRRQPQASRHLDRRARDPARRRRPFPRHPGMNATRDYARLAWPVVAAGLLLTPLILGRGFYLNILDFIGLHSIIAVGLCLLVGYGGQLSISHGAFFAIGAYGSAILSLRAGLAPFAALAATQLLVALVAWGIGAVVLRLRSHYLAIATLSFSIVVAVLIKELAWLTGGLQGLSGVPPLALGGFAFDTDYRFFYLVWPIALLVLI